MSEVKQSQQYEAALASKCQGIAGCLTYNDGEHESSAKHVLLEASHILDGHAVRVHRKKDGLLIINAHGKSRFMTWRERLAVWLLRGKLEVRP